jgi:heme-degrading monooxygenase HmoA
LDKNDVKDFATGNWHVEKGKNEEFISRWTEFLEWTRDSSAGFVYAILIQDVADPNHYISVGYWESSDARSSWQARPMFVQKIGACIALCANFAGSMCRTAVSVK